MSRLLLVLCVLLTCAVGACGNDVARDMSSSKATQSEAGPGSQLDDPLHDAADAIRVLGESKYEPYYSGLAVDAGKRTITVYRCAESGLDRAASNIAISHDVELSLSKSPYSKADLARVRDQISDDYAMWKKRGIRITIMSIVPAGRLDVSIAPESSVQLSEARRLFEKEYGFVGFRFTTDEVVPALPPSSSSATN